jgi:hypothetical protein
MNLKDYTIFYDSSVATAMCGEYMGQALERLAVSYVESGVHLTRQTLHDVYEHLVILRRFYMQKFIPTRQVKRLDELIRQVECK